MSDKVQYTKEFFDRVKNGDYKATNMLYEKTKNIAYQRARSILKNHHDAEDIVDETFMRALEKLDTLDNPKDYPQWVGRIAENKAKDYIKKSKPMLVDEYDFKNSEDEFDMHKSVSPEKMADTNENMELYRKLISKLSDVQRQAVVLNRIEGYKTREIAEMLGCSENTVKSRIRQGEAKLVKEAEKLKKKGYTLNGMMPLDFFTFMSRLLGVSSSNVASIVGTTVVKSIALKIVTGVVAMVVVASGIVGINYLYKQNNVRKETVSITSTTIQTTTMQKYGELTSEEENYAKTLLAYVANSPSNDYSKMSESDIVNILSSCYKVKENYPRGKDLFPTAKVVQNTGMPQVKVSQKDFQKASENIFGKELSDTAKSNSVDLKNGYYYFNVPMDGHTYKLEVQNMQYSEDKSKITVTYTFNSGTTGEEDSTNESVFVRNGDNSDFPLKFVSKN